MTETGKKFDNNKTNSIISPDKISSFKFKNSKKLKKLERSSNKSDEKRKSCDDEQILNPLI